MAMWRPPQRIRYTPDAGRWPTRRKRSRHVCSAPIQVGPLSLTARTWVPAMVPWRATDDGFVTRQRARLVRALRARPAGGDRRRGDRHSRHTQRPAAAHRRRPLPAGLAQAGRRRATSERRRRRACSFSSSTSCASAGAPSRRVLRAISRDHASDIARRLDLLDAPEDRGAARARGRSTSRRWSMFSTPRELEALRFGARERVTDMDAAAHSRAAGTCCPICSPPRRAARARPDSTASSCTTRTPTRWRRSSRGTERPRRRLRRIAGEHACGCRSKCSQRVRARSRRRLRSRVPHPDGRGDRGRQRRRGRVSLCDVRSRAPAWISSRCRAAASSTTRSSPRSARPPIRTPGPAATSACPRTIPTNAVRSAATCNQRRQCVPLSSGAGSRRRSSSAAASTASSRPKPRCSEGCGDIVGLARQALADPDWFRKVRAGRGGEVRLCLYTNYCEALDQRHARSRASSGTAKASTQPGVQLSSDGKRRLLAPDWQERVSALRVI